MARKKSVEFYSVPTECACGCGGVIMNPDDHYRWRKFLPDHANKNGTHPQIGRTEPDENVEKRLEGLSKTLRKKGPTCLEKDLYKFLDSQGIEYVSQKRIKRTLADAYIPKYNLVLFADGIYWHDMEENKEKDKRHNEMLKDLGYNVLRLRSTRSGKTLDFTLLKEFLAENS